MNQVKPGSLTNLSNQPPLPGIEETERAVRPQTPDSSATTMPPSSLPNDEDSIVPAPDIPIGTLLSSLPPTNTSEAPFSSKDTTVEGNPQTHVTPKNDKLGAPSKPGGTADAAPTADPHVEELGRKSQKGKRRAPPQGRKAKHPRLGATQTNLKKRSQASTKKTRNVKRKKVSVVQEVAAVVSNAKNATTAQTPIPQATKAGSSTDKGEKVTTTKVASPLPSSSSPKNVQTPTRQAVKAGSCTDQGKKVARDRVADPLPSHVEKTGGDVVHKTMQSCEGPGRPSRLDGTSLAARPEGEGIAKKNGVVPPSNEVPAQNTQAKKIASSSGVAQGAQKGKGTAQTAANIIAPKGNAKDSRRQGILASKENDTTESDKAEKKSSPEHGGTTLEEKYEDLSRRYMSLVRGLVQSATHKKKSSNSDDDDDDDDDNGTRNGGANEQIVNRKLYDTIYLCKVAGMLGAMKIDGGPTAHVRAPTLAGIEDPYKRVLQDGFEFVEELMMLGRPDENSSASVEAVFRDVHVRLVKDVWERNEDKRGAKGVLAGMIRVISGQLREWYMKMMDGEMSVWWSELISVKLAGAVHKRIVMADEEVAWEIVGGLKGVLKHIAEYYQECERKPETACMDKFCYSCEVSICIARSVSDAALTLDEQDAYAIGRHNGVFSHCVSRLVAERRESE